MSVHLFVWLNFTMTYSAKVLPLRVCVYLLWNFSHVPERIKKFFCCNFFLTAFISKAAFFQGIRILCFRLERENLKYWKSWETMKKEISVHQSNVKKKQCQKIKHIVSWFKGHGVKKKKKKRQLKTSKISGFLDANLVLGYLWELLQPQGKHSCHSESDSADKTF